MSAAGCPRAICGAIGIALAVLMTAGVAAAAPGHAQAPTAGERRRIVGLLDVRGPTSDMTKMFEESLEKQLDTKQYWLVSLASMRERLSNSTSWTDGCQVGPCVTEVRVQTGAELVVLAALTGSGTSFGYVVTLVRTDSGGIVSQETERCDVCTLDEAMNGAILATIRLLVAVPDELPAPGHEQRAAIAAATEDAALKAAAAHQQSHSHSKTTGTVLVITGLVAAAAGMAVYYAAGDKPVAGLVLAGAGGGLAAGGVVVLTF